VSFEIGFEGRVSVERSEMRRKRIPDRGTSMPKTTRCESSVDTRYSKKIERGIIIKNGRNTMTKMRILIINTHIGFTININTKSQL